MQQTRARARLEFLLPQKVLELEAQSNTVERKQIISYTKSLYLPVFTEIAEVMKADTFMMKEGTLKSHKL